MKDITKLYPAHRRTLKPPGKIVFTLALTSLLYSGLGLAVNNSAAASSGNEEVQSSYSSIQMSQTTDNSSSHSSIQVFQSTNHPRNTLPRLLADASALRSRGVSNAILRDASKRSGVPIRELQITQATAKTFGNPCIFNFGEVCTREFKPIEGWEVVVRVQKDSWTYHADKTGSRIVLDPKVSTSQTTALPKEVENIILGDASKRSKIPTADLKITKVTAKTFGNPCEFKFGEICTKEYNPIKGWEVVVEVGRQSWTYHVNESGSQLALDPKISGTARS